MPARWLDDLRFSLYHRLLGRLPAPVRRRLGGAPLLRPLRDWLFRPTGKPQLHPTHVRFEGASFTFRAPLQIASRVKRAGMENRICRLAIDACAPGAVAIDVGAAYGYVTLVMAHAVGAGGKVIAFEADADRFDGLEQNIADNGLRGRCDLWHAFVAERSDGARRITIDDVVARRGLDRVDFVKIDVDGGDADVLRGATRTLCEHQPVVVVEMTRDQAFIVDLLRSHGYVCADMSGREFADGAWPPNVFAAAGWVPGERPRPLRRPTAR